MSFVRNLVSVLTTQIAIAPLGLATSIVLARLLPVHDRGLYAVATELAAFAVVIGQAGWAPTAIYRLRRENAPPDAVATAALTVWLVISAALVGTCLAGRDVLFDRMFPADEPLVLYLALAIVPFQLLGLLFTGLARGLNLFSLHNLYQLLFALLSVVIIGLALLVGDQRTVVALSALLLVHAIVALGLLVLVLRHTGLRLRFPSLEIRASASFGLKTYLQSVLLNVHQRADIFILVYLLDDPAPVALYAVAVGLVNRARIIPNSIATTMFPTAADIVGPELGRFVARVLRHSTFWMVLTVVSLALIGPILVPLLFGSNYADSVAPFMALLPGVASLAAYMVIARYFTARNLHQVNLGIQTVAVALNITLNFVLIPRYGIVGAGLSSLASYGLQGLLGLIFFVWSTGESWRACLVLDGSDLRAYRESASAGWQRILRICSSSQIRGRSKSGERTRS